MKITITEVQNRFRSKGLELLEPYMNTQTKVKCKCKCGKILHLKPHNVFYRNIEQKECYCSTSYRYLPGNKNYRWKGYGDISAKLWHGIKNNAQCRNIPFSLSIEEVWDLFVKQDRLCALTKLPIRFNTKSKSCIDKTASLDRIDSDNGYTLDNVWWVHKFVNETKWDLNLTEYLYWCCLLHNPEVSNDDSSCIEYNHTKRWNGCGNLGLDQWNSIIKRAKSRKLIIDIDIKYAWNLFIKQNGRCALTNVQLWFPQKRGDKRLASLDRIDSSIGYTRSNVQWIHSIINTKLKKHLSQSDLMWITRLVLENYNEN